VGVTKADGRGLFLVLDGVDGCGKSTQAHLLCEWLTGNQGIEPLHVREPGSTAVGERVRALLLDPEVEIAPATETLLFASARRQLQEEFILPAIERGQSVVCERFHPSTYAYQAVAGELDRDAVLQLLNDWATTIQPDCIVILDMGLELALERRGAPSDRIEQKAADYQSMVAAGYREYCERHEHARRVDASGSKQEVFERIVEVLQNVV
jgi:dTMP kinase